MLRKISLAFILIVFASSLYSQDKPDTKYWIYFKDKGSVKPTTKITPGSDAYEKGKALLTEKAIQRRLKVLSEENLIDFWDVPLEEKYINEITKLNIPLIAKSRWLNGVSANLTSAQVKKIQGLKFVESVTAVRRLNKQKFENPLNLSFDENNFSFPLEKSRLNYGKSFNQMNTVNVVKVHDLNITGKGVFLANIDDGFEWRTHQALNVLDITSEHDFVNNDDNAAKEDNQRFPDLYSQGQHGTATLSIMSGKRDGKLYGPAFDSQIILAKTEYIGSETPMEEDFWLEAAEWVEAQGVDVITSSLNYKKWDSPFDSNSYSYKDKNGNRAITTIAADRCAYLGIVVCNSIGNYYQTDEPSLSSPSDGDSIITVGATNYEGKIAGFSSNGPTPDGRTKPDVVAPGVGIWVAEAPSISLNDSTYKFGDGTSYAAPIVAGIASLILSAHPELTPMQVRDAIRNTANNSANPNNIYGWGMVNAYDALLYWGPVWGTPEYKFEDGGVYISIYLASKDMIEKEGVNFAYDNNGAKEQRNAIMTASLLDGNNSGKYETFIPGISDLSKIPEFEFITVVNGKPVRWRSKK